MEQKATIRQAYITFVTEHGYRPPSVAAFTNQLNQSEIDFYRFYGSFEAIERDIFREIMDSSIETLQQGQEFSTFSVRERFLAIYFTWFQKLQSHRSFFLAVEKAYPLIYCVGPYTQSGEEPFKQYLSEQVQAGVESGEIADRFWVPRWYKNFFWQKALFLYRFWLNDKSAEFENTDAAIEKAVNFGFDMIEPNYWDSGLDLMRFLWRNR